MIPTPQGQNRKLPVLAQQVVIRLKNGQALTYAGPVQINLDNPPEIQIEEVLFVNLIPETKDNFMEPSQIVQPTMQDIAKARESKQLTIDDVTVKPTDNGNGNVPDIERVNGPVDERK